MSKKSDAAYDKFLADILAKVPADKQALIKETLESDEVSAVARDQVLSRSEFSRQMDDLAKTRKDVDTELAAMKDKVAKYDTWYGSASKEFSDAKAALDAYEATYGKLDGTVKPPVTGITKEDLERELDRLITPRDAASIDVADMLTDLKIDHRDRFQEKLDSKALIKFATENRLPLDIAYERFVAPKAKALDEKNLNDRIKVERENAVKEYATQHRLPVISEPAELASYEPRKDAPANQRDRVAAAVADFATVK